MKNRFLTRGGLFVSLSVLLVMTSCKKDSAPASGDQGDDQKNASAVALSDSSTTATFAYSDVTSNVFYGYADNMMQFSSRSRHAGSVATMSTTTNGNRRLSCATATLTTTDGGFPKTLVLDFGSGCSTSVDSILRTGKITYVYSGDIFWNGGSVTATFDNYTVNGYGLKGTYTLTNSSHTVANADPQIGYDSVTFFDTRIENGVFTFPDGHNYQYNDSKTYSTKSGTKDFYSFAFDSLSITGESHIVASTGDSLATKIVTPLVKNLTCRNISFGMESFVYNGKISGTLDFGNGDCDNTATVTIGNSSKTITLH